MIRFETVQRRTVMGHKHILAAVTVAMLAAGCMPETPHTYFDWGVNTGAPRPVARQNAKPSTKASAKTYAYVEKDARPTARAVTPVTRQALAPPADAPAFAWPVSGRVVSDFGTTANGGQNDGINIAATMGTPIRASASGTVSYAGDELKNYGNLVLLKHAGGYTTAYAHAERLLVARGDTVTRGQVIGYVGQTGDVASPQLHFEIRAATTPVNPRSYLSASTALN
jgi:murein DD-endopeptidase MepM/ murein hydrolase activator NlpD